MRDIITKDLSVAIDKGVVSDLFSTFEELVIAFRKGDLDSCLTVSGRFVDNTLRAIEFVRKGNAPPEIKSVAAVVRDIEKDKSLSDSLRILIPRIAQAMIYELRSKRGVLHVKEIDPRQIDGSLAMHSAAWIMAEFLRLYHASDEARIMQAMASLMRGQLPLIESFDNELAVTTVVATEVEVLLLLAKFAPDGLDRRALGQMAKCSAVALTRAVQKTRSREAYSPCEVWQVPHHWSR